MDITAALSVVAAAVLSVLTAALANRPGWSAGRKRAVSTGTAVVLGVVAAIATGAIDGIPASWTSWLASAIVSVAVVIGLAQGFHRQWAGALGRLESATSPTATTQAEPVPAPEPEPSVIPDGEGVATN
jgi:hypothetical protein